MKNSNAVKRNKEIDILKCICSFAIVIIHTPFEGPLGTILRLFARIAVPIFFMISGYYYSSDPKRINKQIRKIFYIIIFSHLFFGIFDILMDNIANVNLYMFSKEESVKDIFLQIICFNVSPAFTHLWYLLAYIYVLIILKKFNLQNISNKDLTIITAILLTGNLVLGKYSCIFLGKSMESYISRNFLFTGIPFYLLGYMLATKKNQINEINIYKMRCGMLVCLIFSIIEKCILSSIGESNKGDLYIMSIVLAIVSFIYVLCINTPKRKKEEYIGKIIAKIGNKYTLLIYIMHPAIIQLLKCGLGIARCENMKLVFSVLVYMLTLLLAIIMSFLWVKIHPCKYNIIDSKDEGDN